MEAFQSLLLQVWREACRHIRIDEAAGTLAGMLGRQLPLAGIVVRRVEGGHGTLATVASASTGRSELPVPSCQSLSPSQYRKLETWSSRLQIAHGDATSLPAEIRGLVPPEMTGDFLVGPLVSGKEWIGALLLLAVPGKRFDATHRRVAAALLEPFSAALANDSLLHELAAYREAAEADRRSLLHRLGRQELHDSIVGIDGGLKPVIERVALVAPSDIPVLILGETGTGKEVISRSIHTRSARATGPFMRVNCGAIPAELIDSQLFGHEKGSFTGASEMRQGWFERADGGTLFLDEIGELPLPAQVRLLRVLQDGYLERVGGHQPIRVDVRIVAATHRDLAAMVQTREFREDLWYRLAVFPIVLPPLRERKDDIPELAGHFARRAAIRFGLPVVLPSAADIALLTEYDWPGNIRELGTVIDRAAILGGGKSLEISKALGVFPQHATPSAALTVQPHTPGLRPGMASLDEAMRQHIERALTATHGRIEGPKGAAVLLGINPHTLRARMRKLKIDWSEFRE